MAQFDGFDSEKWAAYYTSLNEELPVEQCPLKLSDDEKEAYIEELEYLLQERKEHPDVPLFYPTTFEKEW